MPARSIVDDFLDGLREAATEFVTGFVEDRFTPIIRPQPKAPRARRVSAKPPKAKKQKAERATKPVKAERTHYDTLQVARNADSEIITAAWKAACRKHHPDTGHGDAKKMAAINSAYEVLKDPIKRREYDRSIR